jgi:hypothetical protein
MNKNYLEGGLRMIDINKYIEATQIKWAKKLTSKNFSNWKVIPFYYYLSFHMNLYIVVLNFDTYSLSILVTDATYVIFGIINDLTIIILPTIVIDEAYVRLAYILFNIYS